MIKVERLTKFYGERAAIRDLTFNIERGEVIGFLGLNGAGKSTTLKVLGCVLSPTSGHVSIDGYDVTQNPHEIRKRIGFLPDVPPLYEEMTVGRYLAFAAELRGVPKNAVAGRVASVEKRCSLTDRHDDFIGNLSHGYRQRVGVAQALIHDPRLLVLDEPTGGLDPRQMGEMRELIKSLKGEHTVLISSHMLSEVSQICDRYLVIHEGQIIASGTEAELATRLGGTESIELEVHGDAKKAEAAVRSLSAVTEVVVSSPQVGVLAMVVSAKTDVRAEVVRALVAAQLDVLRVDKTAARLENIFLRLTQKEAA